MEQVLQDDLWFINLSMLLIVFHSFLEHQTLPRLYTQRVQPTEQILLHYPLLLWNMKIFFFDLYMRRNKNYRSLKKKSSL